jgi:DNA-binding PucR family transcriptional regulator
LPKPLICCADHLSALLLLNDEHLAQQVGDQAMRAFGDMTPVQRDRMESTLLAWLTSTGRSAPEVATILGVHPQTVRYRMHQLMELFGDRLNDPDFRFEVEAALRARALLAGTP